MGRVIRMCVAMNHDGSEYYAVGWDGENDFGLKDCAVDVFRGGHDDEPTRTLWHEFEIPDPIEVKGSTEEEPPE